MTTRKPFRVRFRDAEGEPAEAKFAKLDAQAVKSVVDMAVDGGLASVASNVRHAYDENFPLEGGADVAVAAEEIVFARQTSGPEHALKVARSRQDDALAHALRFVLEDMGDGLDPIRDALEAAGLDRPDFDDHLEDLVREDLGIRPVEKVSEIFGPRERVLVAFLFGAQVGTVPEDHSMEASRVYDVFPVMAGEHLAALFEGLNVDKGAFLEWCRVQKGVDPQVASVRHDYQGRMDEQASAWVDMEVRHDPSREQVVPMQTFWHILENAGYGGAPVSVVSPPARRFFDALDEGRALQVLPGPKGWCGQVGIDAFVSAGHLETAKTSYVLDPTVGSFHGWVGLSSYLDGTYGFTSAALEVDVAAVDAPSLFPTAPKAAPSLKP